MHRILFLDPEFLQNIQAIRDHPADPEIIEAVTEALKRLPPETERLIRERFFEGLSLSEIAERSDIDFKEVVRAIYEGKRQLKILLSEFVKRRWGIKPEGICRVCGHPKRKEIERIVIKCNRSRSWGEICAAVEKATGERFHPPQILKAHIKHMNNNQKENS
ncbi:MAG: sigma-70 family RNA polymerase sigma factor [candidate division Zixibacteria bacterium]